MICEPYYYNRGFNFLGAGSQSKYLEEIESDSWDPELEFKECNVKCLECGQYWYFECAPEESTFPLFGMKYRDHGYEPSAEEVESKKEQLSLLMHGGTSSSGCRIKGCTNRKLNGRELCVKHISFP